jgi:hypothetical protein
MGNGNLAHAQRAEPKRKNPQSIWQVFGNQASAEPVLRSSHLIGYLCLRNKRQIKDKITLESCTMLVKNGDVRLKRSKTRKSPPTKAMVRLTVSLPKAVLSRVNVIAGQMKVSAGWVIRKAVIEFVDRDIPLFRSEGKF